jgi:hypothetical protein
METAEHPIKNGGASVKKTQHKEKKTFNIRYETNKNPRSQIEEVSAYTKEEAESRMLKKLDRLRLEGTIGWYGIISIKMIES